MEASSKGELQPNPHRRLGAVPRAVFRGSAALAMLSIGCSAAPEVTSRGSLVQVVRIWPGPAAGNRELDGRRARGGRRASEPWQGPHHHQRHHPDPDGLPPEARFVEWHGDIIVPGGAFRALPWDLDGTETARWLDERGHHCVRLEVSGSAANGSRREWPRELRSFCSKGRRARGQSRLPMLSRLSALSGRIRPDLGFRRTGLE